jgi:hypothetical protein
MQHAFALIREQGEECLVRRMAAGGDTTLVIATADETVERDLAGGEPRRGLEGDAEEREAGGLELAREVGGVEVRELEAIRIETGTEAGREPVEVAFDAKAAGGAVRHEVDPRGGFTATGGLELRAVPPPEMEKHGLDVLAGAEAIAAKVGASTGELATVDRADLYAIVEPRVRMDLEQ